MPRADRRISSTKTKAQSACMRSKSPNAARRVMWRDLWFGRVFGSFLRLPGREPGHVPEGFADAQPGRAAKGLALARACRDADAGLRGTSTAAVFIAMQAALPKVGAAKLMTEMKTIQADATNTSSIKPENYGAMVALFERLAA